MPKQKRETWKESHTCIHETTEFMFVFSGSVSTNYDRDCNHSANRSYKHQTVLLTLILGREPCKLYLCCHLLCPLLVLMSLSLLPSFQFFSQENHPGLSLQTSTRGTRTTITKRQIDPLVDPFPHSQRITWAKKPSILVEIENKTKIGSCLNQLLGKIGWRGGGGGSLNNPSFQFLLQLTDGRF